MTKHLNMRLVYRNEWCIEVSYKTAIICIPVNSTILYYNLAHLIALHSSGHLTDDELDLQAWLQGHYA